ncbi:hypothetical protein LEP1GSC172_1902 [Leptospira noguchii]|uniref:Uncharacterized protein n=1 Tax=Leptospira noguchii TaxID=28182 RepID=M6VV92_9LEPT|nr:hypothetical protein LEP1GSC172_1902 [Leptospira noguchii]
MECIKKFNITFENKEIAFFVGLKLRRYYKKQFASIFLKLYDKILGHKFISNINKIECTR